ncbi:MAG: hypothetical protein ACTS8S_13600 [Giesbergeria sp.]
MSLLISGLTSLASLLFNAASGSGSKGAAARRAGQSPEAGAAALVHLSPEAQALAGLAGQGAVFAQPVQGARLDAVRQGSAEQALAATSPRSVPNENFQELLSKFGADANDKKLLLAGFDSDQNGAITQAEFLKGLARTAGGQTDSDFSQALRRLMDSAGDGNASVSKSEFAAFSQAYATATSGKA